MLRWYAGWTISKDVELFSDFIHVDDEGFLGAESSTGFRHQRSGRAFLGGEVGMTNGRKPVGHAQTLERKGRRAGGRERKGKE